jgi:hypothetical protein
MPEFMDVHRGMIGITADGLTEAHNADLAIQDEKGSYSNRLGRTLTVGSSTACPRQALPTPFNVFTRGPATLLTKSMPCR